MNYGKLTDISQVDFRLPKEPPENTLFFEKMQDKAPRKSIFLGATGYHMAEWKGKWYPQNAPQKDFLKAYGKQFNSIEHNSTHYRIPTVSTVEKWYHETPSDFRFSPKIPQAISHSVDLGLNNSNTTHFCEVLLGLKEKLGVCFMQLPPYFSVEKLPLLAHFLSTFSKEIRLAVEVRHASFYENNAASAAYWALLEKYSIGAVITDVAGERKDCHMRLTAPFSVLRLVGNGMVPTDFERLEDWANRLHDWFEQGLETVYVFCHQPDNLLAPDYCVSAGKVFSEKIKDVSLRFPELLPTLGIQGSLF